MARKEIIQNNKLVQQALNNISITTLCSEAKETMRKLIQESESLGKTEYQKKMYTTSLRMLQKLVSIWWPSI